MDRQTFVEEISAVCKEVGKGILSAEDGQALIIRYVDDYVDYIKEGLE
jgi:hypothetical protein